MTLIPPSPDKCRFTLTAEQRHHHFWSSLRTLVEDARCNMSRWSGKEWAWHLDDKNRLLVFAPQSWLRRLWGKFNCKDAPTGDPSTRIHMVRTIKKGRIDIGQTGAITTVRSLVQRFRQHCRGAWSWLRLCDYGGKGTRKPTTCTLLWPVRVPSGLVSSPLQKCEPHRADCLEQAWIRSTNEPNKT